MFIGSRASENTHKLVANRMVDREERAEKFHGTFRIAHVLYRFKTFDVVEEPTAARKGEQTELFDFHQTNRRCTSFFIARVAQDFVQEIFLALLFFRLHEDVHVKVAGVPSVDLADFFEFTQEHVIGKLFQEVHRITKRRAPLLIPVRTAAR